MIPQNRLSTLPIVGALADSAFLRDPLKDAEFGGTALQDPSLGLLVKMWHIRYDADVQNVVVWAQGTGDIVLFTRPNITELSLAFDRNMAPTVAFVQGGQAKLYWYSPDTQTFVFWENELGAAVNPRVTHDDKRFAQSAVDDVILAYVRAGNLYYRQQRDKFAVERLLMTGVTRLYHVGMNQYRRLQFRYDGPPGAQIDGTCGYSVAGIIEELCLRAGMDPQNYSVAGLFDTTCRGFTVVNQYATTGALSALAQIFLFDPSNYDGAVHFVPRGANAVATVDDADLVVVQQADGAPDPMQAQTQRGDSVAIPQTLNLNYYDVDGGLTTSLQVSRRVGDPRATGSRDLQTAVMLSADEAARVARINHQVAVEEARAQFNFALSDQWLQLTPADTVFLQYRGKPWRLRLTQITMNDGMQDYQALVDRQSAYTSDLQGYPAYAPTPPPSPVVGPTVIEPLDIHIISDTDDSLGCYVALGRGAPAWQGAVIDVSLDGGASYFDSFTLTAAATVGTLGSALLAHPAEYPDADSRCTVDLLYDQDELEAASQMQMQNGANLAIVGDEVLQFEDVAETSTPGTWELGYFFRGRKGTAAVAHAAGERFVLLERNSIAFIPMQLSYLGRTLTIRATSLNGSDSDVTTASLTYTGQSQTEYPVAYLRGRRNGAASLLQWQGVGKLGAGATVAMGVHFAGYLVTLTDGATTQQDTVTQQSYTFDAAAFTGPITATVQAVNALTGNGPAVQIII